MVCRTENYAFKLKNGQEVKAHYRDFLETENGKIYCDDLAEELCYDNKTIKIKDENGDFSEAIELFVL